MAILNNAEQHWSTLVNTGQHWSKLVSTGQSWSALVNTDFYTFLSSETL